jgi:hypothetical protein
MGVVQKKVNIVFKYRYGRPQVYGSIKKCRNAFSDLVENECFNDTVSMLIADYKNTIFSLDEKKRFVQYLKDNVASGVEQVLEKFIDNDYHALYFNKDIKEESFGIHNRLYDSFSKNKINFYISCAHKRESIITSFSRYLDFNAHIENHDIFDEGFEAFRNYELYSSRVLSAFVKCAYYSDYVNKSNDSIELLSKIFEFFICLHDAIDGNNSFKYVFSAFDAGYVFDNIKAITERLYDGRCNMYGVLTPMLIYKRFSASCGGNVDYRITKYFMEIASKAEEAATVS